MRLWWGALQQALEPARRSGSPTTRVSPSSPLVARPMPLFSLTRCSWATHFVHGGGELTGNDLVALANLVGEHTLFFQRRQPHRPGSVSYLAASGMFSACLSYTAPSRLFLLGGRCPPAGASTWTAPALRQSNRQRRTRTETRSALRESPQFQGNPVRYRMALLSAVRRRCGLPGGQSYRRAIYGEPNAVHAMTAAPRQSPSP